MIKVLHLISSFRKGGTERQLTNLLKNSTDENFRHLALASTDQKPSYLEEFDLHELVKIGNGAIYSSVKQALKETQPDVVVAWSYKESIWGFLACFGTGRPFINASIKHGLFQGRKKDHIRKVFFHLSKYRIANSRAGLRVNGIERGNVVYNGIDESFFFDIKSAQRKNTDSQSLNILSVGSLTKIKDYPTILRGLAEIEVPFNYRVLGEGPEKQNLIHLSNELGIADSVDFLGNGKNVKDFLAESDVFIHASRGEGCCNAILEAMASGLPVIASATGGTPEIVPDGKGFLFEAGNYHELSQYITLLATDKELRLETGRSAYEYARQEFTIMKFVEHYNNIIYKVVHG